MAHKHLAYARDAVQLGSVWQFALALMGAPLKVRRLIPSEGVSPFEDSSSAGNRPGMGFEEEVC
jgi:hypothetical protein